MLGKAIEHEHNLFDLLRRPGVGYADLITMARQLTGAAVAVQPVSRETLGALYAPVLEQVEIAAKYSGYIDRQVDEVQRAAHYEDMKLPAELDYLKVTALSFEARQKLNQHRPETLGQVAGCRASRQPPFRCC